MQMDYKHSHKTPRGHILTKMETMGTIWELYEKYFWTTWHLGQLGDQLTPLGNCMKNIWALLGIFADITWANLSQFGDRFATLGNYIDNTWEPLGNYMDETVPPRVSQAAPDQQLTATT